MTAIENIKLFEQLAQVAQKGIKLTAKGGVRDRVVNRLARIDQLIAKCKDEAGILGKDECAYLKV